MLVNFGPQTKKVIDVHIDPPKWILFGRLYFGPYGVMCPGALKFLYALEIAENLLTHTQTGTGVPPPKKNDENLKFC